MQQSMISALATHTLQYLSLTQYKTVRHNNSPALLPLAQVPKVLPVRQGLAAIQRPHVGSSAIAATCGTTAHARVCNTAELPPVPSRVLRAQVDSKQPFSSQLSSYFIIISALYTQALLYCTSCEALQSDGAKL